MTDYEHHSKVERSLQRADASKMSRQTRMKDSDDRATVEQVLDPRTRKMIFGMINRGVMESLGGCLSTGKEANVYYAKNADGAELAVKIYKTSILVFKDRDRYVSGEHRFRTGYAKNNPRKMVATWAEKEMRNLSRLRDAGIPAPRVHALQKHVLAMDLVGKDGVAAPRLKDAVAEMSAARVGAVYWKLVEYFRRMYHGARLVHADLSEYNMLYYSKRLWVIDVSQSVEQDHPMALEFLRMDARNVTNFFRRHGVATMTPRELFEFTLAPETSPLTNIAERKKAARQRGVLDDDAMNNIDELVHFQATLRRALSELGPSDAERLILRIRAASEGAAEGGAAERDALLLDTAVMGIDVEALITETEAAREARAEAEADDHSESESEPEEEADEDDPHARRPAAPEPGSEGRAEWVAERLASGRLSRAECTKEEWDEIQRQVKRDRSEKRAQKIPKHVKVRAKNLSMRARGKKVRK